MANGFISLLVVLISTASMFADNGEEIFVKSSSIRKNVVITEAQIGDKNVELECSLPKVPCSPPDPGKYVMVKLSVGGIYQDCTNVDLYRYPATAGSNQKVGTYCLLQDGTDRCYVTNCVSVQVSTITPEQLQSERKAVQPSTVEILTDAQGVDFGPSLKQVVSSVQTQWYALIPDAARKPQLKQGTVTIEFAILKDGRVAGMKLAQPSGDVSLDRAAWGGITASQPFKPLPAQFTGPYLGLRFRFYYNADAKKDANALPPGAKSN
jgi:TonB family protein